MTVDAATGQVCETHYVSGLVMNGHHVRLLFAA